jgi:hypothetical protein
VRKEQFVSRLWNVLLALAIGLGLLSAEIVLARSNKADICHVDDEGNIKLINVSKNAVQAHLRHGDFLLADSVFYADVDGDGLGDAGDPLEVCTVPNGFVDNADDCDDTTSDIGEPQELYADTDGDLFGDPNTAQTVCPAEGLVEDGTDCDDTNNAVNPDATEIVGNGIDDDCNSATPDAPAVTCPCADQVGSAITLHDIFITQPFDGGPNLTCTSTAQLAVVSRLDDGDVSPPFPRPAITVVANENVPNGPFCRYVLFETDPTVSLFGFAALTSAELDSCLLDIRALQAQLGCP